MAVIDEDLKDVFKTFISFGCHNEVPFLRDRHPRAKRVPLRLNSFRMVPWHVSEGDYHESLSIINEAVISTCVRNCRNKTGEFSRFSEKTNVPLLPGSRRTHVAVFTVHGLFHEWFLQPLSVDDNRVSVFL